MRLAATCACLFLMPLAFMQSVSNCIVNIRRSPCSNLLNYRYKSDDMTIPKTRLLIFQNHFVQLNSTEKICFFKKVLEFYTLVNEEVWTKKIPEQHICELHNHLVYFEDNCLQCEACQEIFGNKTKRKKKGCRGIFESKAKPKKKCYQEVKKKRNEKTRKKEKRTRKRKKKVCKGMFGDETQSSECSDYKSNMDLNGTGILNCQLSRLKIGNTTRPAKVQETIFFELEIFQSFLRTAEQAASREDNYNGR